MHHVNSQMFTEVHWEDNKLYIRFKGGKFYRYVNVPESVFNALLQAHSKGQFFNSTIRGKYDFTQIVESELPASYATINQ